MEIYIDNQTPDCFTLWKNCIGICYDETAKRVKRSYKNNKKIWVSKTYKRGFCRVRYQDSNISTKRPRRVNRAMRLWYNDTRGISSLLMAMLSDVFLVSPYIFLCKPEEQRFYLREKKNGSTVLYRCIMVMYAAVNNYDRNRFVLKYCGNSCLAGTEELSARQK